MTALIIVLAYAETYAIRNQFTLVPIAAKHVRNSTVKAYVHSTFLHIVLCWINRLMFALVVQMRRHAKETMPYYTAHRAHAEYVKELSSSRKGIRTSPERLLELNDLLMPLVNKGQSINHIFATHSDEIRLSKKTIYNYIDQSAFRVRNIDLPKKVRYKQRHSHEVLMKFDYQYRKGRTYTDFTSFMEQNPKLPIVEMDTVIGARNSGKVLLTILFRDTNFMLIFLLPDKSHQSVLHVFDKLTSLLGIELFRKLFPVRMRKHVIR